MRVLFAADQFTDAPRTPNAGHPGGAELTDRAAIDACPYPVESRTFERLDPASVAQFDLIVVGNSATATPEHWDAITATGRHVLFEHDVRICLWRGNFPASPEPIHRMFQRCRCPHRHLREVYATSRGVVFLTALQRDAFIDNPFFEEPPSGVIGCSLFGGDFFARVDEARRDERRRTGTAIFGAHDRIKGYDEALAHCIRQGLSPLVIQNMPPSEVLDVFARSERFVYLPIGLEPAGRMPVEARFLGCDVTVNEHVGVAGEAWWNQPDEEALQFVRRGPQRFWEIVFRLADIEP